MTHLANVPGPRDGRAEHVRIAEWGTQRSLGVLSECRISRCVCMVRSTAFADRLNIGRTISLPLACEPNVVRHGDINDEEARRD